jgi:hypothetical protein
MKFKTIALAIALACVPMSALAQPAAPIQNLYAAGPSYSTGETGAQAVAGTALYAHALTDSGTYAFTVLDAVPNTLKPFTVNTNIGIGVAQKVATIKGVDVFAPLATGFTFNGQNAGWNWNGGGMAVIPFKGYYILPSVRFLKASIGGSGYQPIIGLAFGWGK